MKRINLVSFEQVFGSKFVEKFITKIIDENLEYSFQNIDNEGYYLILKEDGIDFSFSKEYILETINFYGKEYIDQYNEFKYQLPFELNFDMSQKEVRYKKGKPTKTTLAIPALNVFEIDIYEFANYQFSIDYSRDKNSILSLQVTLRKP